MDTKYKLALSPSDPGFPEMIETTEIPGLLIYKRETHEDERGFFHEIVELRDLEKVLGKKISVVQSNHARSKPGVIRGFHSEPWEKIIYVAKGEVMAVIVDFRIDSPAFGKAVKIMLGDKSRNTIYLPLGMGNSLCVTGNEDAEYLYLITNYFEGKPTPAVYYKDPMLTKQFGGWPVENPIVSAKDESYPTLKEKFGQEVDFSKFPWLNE
ncbi:MAG: dTDP-4-dehydrorhamnose 3,5-epimerase family protein [Candidatus Levybacteria bacterium]|nr:dTDP-4-dehydrorhamnose 3,5-epimerase family protein [Candidatus Levybacteria bacterium]